MSRTVAVIDDERLFVEFPPDTIYLRTPDAALAFLARQWTDQQARYGEDLKALYLDHDLSQDALGTAMDIIPVVRFLHLLGHRGWPLKVDEILVHSQNAPGADMIVKQLGAFYNVKRVPLPASMSVSP